jgi:hypothetical protein
VISENNQANKKHSSSVALTALKCQSLSWTTGNWKTESFRRIVMVDIDPSHFATGVLRLYSNTWDYKLIFCTRSLQHLENNKLKHGICWVPRIRSRIQGESIHPHEIQQLRENRRWNPGRWALSWHWIHFFEINKTLTEGTPSTPFRFHHRWIAPDALSFDQTL